MAPLLRLLCRAILTLRRPRRWLHRRLTPVGWALAVGMAACLGTNNPEQTMGMSVFFLLAAVFACALALAPFFRPRAAAERRPPRLVTAGEPFTVRVRVANRGRRPLAGLAYVEDLREPAPTARACAEAVRTALRERGGAIPWPRGARSAPVALPDLPAGAAAEITVTVTAWRRGALTLAGGVLTRADPLGVFRACCRLPAPHTVLVMPRRHPLPRLDLPGSAQHQQGGVALAAGVGESEEFTALRDYRRGDPLKHVHWRSTARTGTLVVKEYQDEHFTRHGLVLDTACGPEGDHLFEEAVAVAASFACTVPDQDSLLDLLLVGQQAVCITSGRGVGHAEQMLEALAAVRPCRDPGLERLEALVDRHRPQLSGCVLVLLAWDPPRRALVRRLREQGLPLLVLVLVPAGGADLIAAGLPEERPQRLVALEAGRVAQGLAALGERP
ncbi:MAG: DUF58 domain-containing protein [Planctomycetes bacterium]|nr:DUF58 domain-containing protein [Planctomycetota bacterium]